MKEFKVLPTDPRFRELTGDQLSFINQQWELDLEQKENTTPENTPGYDPDFDEDNPDKDYYEDPDFDEAWNDDRDISEETWEEV